MSRLEMAVFAYCLLVVGAGFVFFPMYYAIRLFRARRRQIRSFFEVIVRASTAPPVPNRLLIEHPPLLTPGSDASIDLSRAAGDEPNGSTQPSRVQAA